MTPTRSVGRFCLLPGRGLESERGHLLSREGRASRAEKFLLATASKNVLGQASPGHKA